MVMKWLITGGCGFIGLNLIRRILAETEDSIRIVDNLSVGKREYLAKLGPFHELKRERLSHSSARVEFFEGDILDDALAIALADGVDVIVHLAANTGVAPSVENPRLDCVTNVQGTLNYLEAAREAGVKRFIFASSGAPVGEVEPPIHEELAPHPVSPYGASKLAGEGYCSAYFRTFGVKTVCLRFGNVYGPGSIHKTSVVAKFISAAVAGESLEIYGDGSQTRDFIYVDDLTRAIFCAVEARDMGGEIFQIATNQETTVADLVIKLQCSLSRAGITVTDTLFSEPRLGDVLRNFSETSKAARLLKWQSRYTLEEGLDKTVAAFLAEREAS